MPSVSLATFEGMYAALEGRVPDAAEYQAFSGLAVEVPQAAALAALDPWSPAYAEAAMALYQTLRAAPERGAYDPARDELSEVVGEDLWTGVTPWSFRDPKLVAEFLFSWGQILQLLDLDPTAGGSLLEYGPGSGQLLLIAARLGFRAHAVDIEPRFLSLVERQASAMGLQVATECAVFGEGFVGQRFDRILFFEAFHHAFHWQALLRRLRERLEPGGRLILAGEPVIPMPMPSVPFPWGPRLDALSIYCMRRFGWMELGFQRAFLLEALRRDGWQVAVHEFPQCGRALAFVCEPSDEPGPATWHGGFKEVFTPGPPIQMPPIQMNALQHLAAALEASPFRPLAKPLRAAWRSMRRRS